MRLGVLMGVDVVAGVDVDVPFAVGVQLSPAHRYPGQALLGQEDRS